MQAVPLPVRVPKRFDEKSARRGVGSCGLWMVNMNVLGTQLSMLRHTSDQCGSFETGLRQG